jgi:NADH-quinone oxidoreductase subunit J
MGFWFYTSATLAIIPIALAVTARQAVHGLLYLLVGLLALAINLYASGNEVGAALLVIVYAGAIMVLFIFVVMLLNQGPQKSALSKNVVRNFIGPLVLCALLLIELCVLLSSKDRAFQIHTFSAKEIASALYQDGWVFVELLSMLLTAALVGAFHIGRQR